MTTQSSTELIRRAVVLFEDQHTRVARLWYADGSRVIHKERLGPNAMTQVRHERRILQRLAGVEGVPALARTVAPIHVLAMEDIGGVILAEHTRAHPFELPQLLALAVQLTTVIAAIHRAGVMHKDLNPSNVLLTEPLHSPVLIDFDLATTFAEERPAFVHHREIAGTLSYLAPEQTGRMSRAVDQRTDLYALGATFYELACGQPPLADNDPLTLIRDILARVPTPLLTVNPAVPPAFSAIVARLLEKEPDQRYQSAEGLLYDLVRLSERLAQHDGSEFALGNRDFPPQLLPPSRPVGRDGEIGELRNALERALQSPVHGMLIAGPSGVGKTTLINELRPLITAQRGWFVSAKFDQYRQATAAGALAQVMYTLADLLMAETDLGRQRQALLQALGPNAGLVAAVDPRLAALLEVPPEIADGDPVEVAARKLGATLDLLRALAQVRPIVLVLDDLQWADASSLNFIHGLLGDTALRRLLLVGAYRVNEIDAAHPLAALLTRWQQAGVVPAPLVLGNLPPADLQQLLAQLLHMPAPQVLQLAALIDAHTGGNPYNTLELINALRRDNLLSSDASSWHWTAKAVSQYIGTGAVADLVVARIARLPPDCQSLLEVMACLGNEVALDLFAAASGYSLDRLEQALMPALEDGLLVLEQGQEIVRFRHDRIQQALHDRVDVAARCQLQLGIARKLAAVAHFSDMAAALYLDSAEAIAMPEEGKRVLRLFQRAAARAHFLVLYGAEERFLAAALALEKRSESALDELLHRTLQDRWHAALYSLGRLDDADRVYRDIEARGSAPLELIAPTCVQISSLTNRGRLADAVQLGLRVLNSLGFPLPAAADLDRDIEQGMADFYQWLDKLDPATEAERPACEEPPVLAAAMLINRMAPPAFFSDPRMVAWLWVTAHRLASQRGPCAELLGMLSHAAFVSIGLHQNFRAGYTAIRHLLAMAEIRGYVAETPQALFLFALSSAHWFEPLEECVQHAQEARQALLHNGDVQNACFTYYVSLPMLLDCAPTVDVWAAEAEEALALTTRTGNDYAAQCYAAHLHAAQILRGSVDRGAPMLALEDNHTAMANIHFMQGWLALCFDDAERLFVETATAVALVPYIQATYPVALIYLLRALALARRLHTLAPEQREPICRELQECHEWLARRAADYPDSFLSALRWVEAERAWALDDFRVAAAAFDAALAAEDRRSRPWRRAVLTERVGLFYLAHGLPRAARALLARAHRFYGTWGASAKVQQMEREHAITQRDDETRPQTHRSGLVMRDSLDMLAILRASQALSSETNLGHLKRRVEEVLGTLTGATHVSLALRGAGNQWMLSPSQSGDAEPLSLEQAVAQKLLPLSVFRYVERNHQPLVIDDATQDERFARDPYFAGLGRCSLLAVPILSHGACRAILLLENRLSRGAFLADRLDAVTLITGQLAVSLDNASLYASLEHKVAERTAALEVANQRLQELSVTDSLTGLANRRRFTEIIEAEWLRALRAQTSIGVAMIDVDHFKRYNDHYGHQAGDACLQLVAGVLRQIPRNGSDLIARYGGEEFVLILPNTDLASARVVAERLRAAVAARQAPHAQTSAGFVSVSVGVAALIPAADSTPAQLIERADKGLYLAKQAGRNRVESV